MTDKMLLFLASILYSLLERRGLLPKDLAFLRKQAD
jgi:hypothetical protein